MPDPVILSEPKHREEQVIIFEGAYASGPTGATLKVDTDEIVLDAIDDGIPSIRLRLKQKDGGYEEICHHKPLLCWYSVRRTTLVWPEIEKPAPKRSPTVPPAVDINALTGML